MDFTAILNWFDPAVPVGIVAIIIYLVVLGRDMKHIRGLLSNHVTGTEKKINELKQDQKEFRKEFKEDRKELKADIHREFDKLHESLKNIQNQKIKSD